MDGWSIFNTAYEFELGNEVDLVLTKPQSVTLTRIGGGCRVVSC